MRKDLFVIALACSLLWHIAGFQVVKVIWPKQLQKRQFSEVNFWGSILEGNTVSISDDVESENFNSDLEPVALGSVETQELEKAPLPFSEIFDKSTPEIEPEVFDDIGFKIIENFDDEFKRGVMFKPDLPPCPEWAKELSGGFEIELRFLILPDGTVGGVENITSSGYIELDEIGVRYIRRWKFVPLSEDSPDKFMGKDKVAF